MTLSERLALVRAVIHLWSYLKGCWFTFCIDHHALTYTLNSTNSTRKLGHWPLRFLESESYIVHCAGIMREEASVLSGLKTTTADEMLIEADISLLCITFSIPPKNKRLELCICKMMMKKATGKVSDCLKYTG